MKDEQDRQNKIDEMKIIREVNIQAETFYAEAKQLGDYAADTFGEKHRSQITGLENIAESAFKTSDIFDYIKRQTARHKDWQRSDFGKKLIEKLETKLDNNRKIICASLEISEKTEGERQERRRIYLLLIRQFIRQMAVEYEFQVSFGKGARRNGTH
ncbi:MAG TPA: hypothetical protein VEL31_03335 [Ktedonobacteraceae bacterium]|nr:hypothetical protein [Ktedonobacteraceae bacterium]